MLGKYMNEASLQFDVIDIQVTSLRDCDGIFFILLFRFGLFSAVHAGT